MGQRYPTPISNDNIYLINFTGEVHLTPPVEKVAVATFSIPTEDAARIEHLRLEVARAGHLLNRSEVVRLGLLALEGTNSATINDLVSKLSRKRPGRVKGQPSGDEKGKRGPANRQT